MGLIHVTVKLSAMPPGSSSWEADFLVDTGATDCLAPGNELTNIGIQPVGKTIYELADGSKKTLEFGGAQIEFLGDITFGRIIFGPDGVEPILGVTALESTGILVDPKSQTLKRLPAIPLK